MKLCVSSYGFYWTREKTLDGLIAVVNKAAEMGFEGVEFMEYDAVGLAEAKALRAACAAAGITPVNLCCGAHFATPFAAETAAQVEELKRRVDVAAELGCAFLRHDAARGPLPEPYPQTYAAAVPYMAEGIRRVTEYAASVGVKTLTENHGQFSQDARRVESLIKAVDHPNFGALVDIGNFMCVDEDPPASVAVLAPYARHVHCKDFLFKSASEPDPGEGWLTTRGGNRLRGCNIGSGAAKTERSVKALLAAGYDGWWSVEYEGSAPPEEGIREGTERLKEYLGNSVKL
ncbi:MAG: sugar phosphate isomerase/epimerase [Clostridia bacterium]|nr:sugar phosphate isomerase/epimerase [Clostridia bacterium]